MGTNYYMVKTKPSLAEPLHIGKYSGGWKFVFHYVDYNYEHQISLRDYNSWKAFIETRVRSGEYVILNEYENIVEPDELFELIEQAQNNDNPDNFTYDMNIDGYRFTRSEFC